MDHTYTVTMDHQTVGEACVHQLGLYSQITCKCKFRDKGIYRLEMDCLGQKRKLGVMIPEENGFALHTTIPSKYIDEKNTAFRILTEDHSSRGNFAAIEQGKPFAFITQLEDCVFAECENTVGLQIRKVNHP